MLQPPECDLSKMPPKAPTSPHYVGVLPAVNEFPGEFAGIYQFTPGRQSFCTPKNTPRIKHAARISTQSSSESADSVLYLVIARDLWKKFPAAIARARNF